MNSISSWLNWLFKPKCWFCNKKVNRINPHTVHIKHEHGIEKVKICEECILGLYRGGGVTNDGKKPF